jgi:large subunit ribosomal protein L25
MSAIKLEAELRTDTGKGSSRRLRRLENKVPGIIYGGDKAAKMIHLMQNKVHIALETESIYSSVFDLKVDGKVEHVILKDIQRHPYKPTIMHMDFQRVSAKDVLVKMIPLHFINEAESKGVKAGGLVSHTMNQVEVKCQVKDLPEFINVDLLNVALNDVLHLTDLQLPKGVKLTADVSDAEHNHPVVSIHLPKVVVEEEVIEEEVAEEEESAAPEAPTSEE